MKDNVTKTKYGYDIVWANNDLYCSKILVFEKEGAITDLYFHKQKVKTWFVNSGSFRVQWVDTKDGKSYAQELAEGATFHVESLTPVKLESTSVNSVMAETSSVSDDNDYYKLG